MNVVPGSAFFQTVQGSAASSGGGGAAAPAPASSSPAPAPQAAERQRPAAQEVQIPQQLRQGPPGTNLNIVV